MPRKSILEQKQAVVADLAEMLKNSPAGVLVNYQGITVDADTKLRKALREAGVKYMVMKNSLTGRACDEVGLGDMKQYLSGMTAIAISQDDPIAAAKIMKQYADKVKGFEIKAGFVDGGMLDQAGVIDLAETPSKEVLIGRMMGSLQSSLYSFAYVLQAIIDKDGEAAPAEEAAATEEAPAEA